MSKTFNNSDATSTSQANDGTSATDWPRDVFTVGVLLGTLIGISSVLGLMGLLSLISELDP